MIKTFPKKKDSGFFLIEIIVYIALFSILMTGLFIASQSILQNSNLNTGKIIAQDEINFVMQKINWTLSGTSSIARLITPNVTNQYTNILSLKRSDGIQVDIRYVEASSSIEMREGGEMAEYIPLTSQNVSVTNLSFQYSSSIGSTNVYSISASTTIDGMNGSLTTYVQ